MGGGYDALRGNQTSLVRSLSAGGLGLHRNPTEPAVAALLALTALVPLGAMLVADAASLTSGLQLLQARRGYALGLLALLWLALVSIPTIDAIRAGVRGRQRTLAIVLFVAFDWFAVLGAWRTRRGASIPVPDAVFVGSALVTAMLGVAGTMAWWAALHPEGRADAG